ncbi:uncharacterized protein LOC130714153 [Lotus japonicus]|uniref:uncharacterized protein LOC130714153 n=1 Tax=Lotus japonicus TaxID=34305 RepID=UPI00258F2206|nr:uncharacterized protein LOC130714153 [Lotus japonicus]
MGNCIVPASSMEWGGDDWGSLRSDENTRSSSSSNKVIDETHVLSFENVPKEKLLGALRGSCDANGKVKIKISKKEVAELLGVIEKHQMNNKKKQVVGGASAEQVLLRLINANHHHHDHDAPWRPVLETVPED